LINGNAIEPNVTLAESGGSCTGDPYEYCGNTQYMLVYPQRPVPLTPPDITNPWIPPGDANYKFSIVYQDAGATGLFGSPAPASTSSPSHINVEICLNYCATAAVSKYQFAALENGQ
jgi:hypothetical protein